nr:hypothetical protein GCM10025732_37360 [Glycomyces mayteni]
MTDRSVFAARHIGTDPADQDAMLKAVGYPSLEALMDACMPALIRSRDGLALPPRSPRPRRRPSSRGWPS